MIQGPQLINQALSHVAERLVDPVQPAEREILSSAINGGRFARSAEGVAGTEKAATGDVVTVFTRTANREAIAHIQTEGLRSELVRAETMLQIAQEAFTAIEILYDGLLEIAVMALDEDLTKDQRKDLNAAFQELLQDVKDIIDATVFDGEHLLKGGDGPDGAFVIHLSAGGEDDEPLEILIPSASVIKDVQALELADLLTVEGAQAAVELSGMASEVFKLQGDAVEAHRAALQKIFSDVVGSNQSLTDYVATFDSPKYVESLSHLVADIVLAGGKVPFEDSADRLRDILERVTVDIAPRAIGPIETHVTQLTASEPSGAMGDLVRADKILQTAESLLASKSATLTYMRGLAQNASGDLTDQPGYRATLDEYFQAHKGHDDIFAREIEVHGEKVFAGGDGPDGDYVIRISPQGIGGEGFDIAIPSMEFENLLPELVDETIATPEAALAVLDKIDTAIDDIALLRQTVRHDHAQIHRLMSVEVTGEVSPVQIAESIHGSDDDELKAAIIQTALRPNDLVITDELRDQIRRAVHDAEMPKIRDLDGLRRATGPVLQVWDSDVIKESDLSIRAGVYEGLADQDVASGAPHLIEANGFMAELIRADNMLHIADSSIEQIDVYLDYMHGLAEESSSNSSRYRTALNELFQVVKLSIIDTLAQTAVAQGERILAGGDGVDGAFVIRLSEGGLAGQGHEIAIPSMLIKDLSPTLPYADIRTREAATAAMDYVEIASQNVGQTREMIAEQRVLIRQLIHLEMSQNG